MKTHKNLDVWKNAIQLVTCIYKQTEKFPKSELYGLTNQIRRCSISIPSNIAEGAGRFSKKEFAQFLYISSGSLSELETQLIIGLNLNYITESVYQKLENKMNLIRSQLFGLIKSIKTVTK